MSKARKFLFRKKLVSDKATIERYKKACAESTNTGSVSEASTQAYDGRVIEFYEYEGPEEPGE
ncbi:unnamed protein product [Prunus armeniaca]